MTYSIEILLSQLLGEAKHGGGSEFVYSCPFCVQRTGSASYKKKLHVNVEDGLVHCFRCGYKANALTKLIKDLSADVDPELLKRVKSTPTFSADDTLKSFIEGMLEQDQGIDKKYYMINMPESYRTLSSSKSYFARRCKSYLATRGVDDSMVEHYEIGYCTEGKYADMIIFPVFKNGYPVFFTSRGVGTDNRVLNPSREECPLGKSEWVFNIDVAHTYTGEVVIVESIIDALTTGDHAVALFGKDMSQAQFSQLMALPSDTKFTVMMDSDAQMYTHKIVKKFQGIREVHNVLLESGDPNENRHQIHDLLQEKSAPSVGDQVASLLGRKRSKIA